MLRRILPLALAVGALLHGRSLRADETDRVGSRGLLDDVERVVWAQSGWFVDAEELEEVSSTLLESVCRATPEARQTARTVLQERAAAAGDPYAKWEAAGRRFDAAVDAAVKADRELRALDLALTRAPVDCPFWVQPEPGFDGRQVDRGELTLSLETGGMAQIRQTDGTLTVGGGGAGRILPGYGFGDFTLLGGIEFGGGALIRPRTTPTSFAINFFPAVPVVLRFRNVAWHYDLEVAAVSLFQADDASVSWGGRIGGAIGVSALRTRNILPWAGFAVAYEHYVESGGRPVANFVRGGLRIGAMWDP